MKKKWPRRPNPRNCGGIRRAAEGFSFLTAGPSGEPREGEMHKHKFTLRALVAAAVLFAVSAASAQQPSRIRGQIEKADGGMLSVKTRDGAMLNVKVADDARVAALVKASAAD